ncbi:MAG: helix-turn-helix domain-containing protein, partial [Clostridiales bacterium]|nr:helix-turn-helix domain-containing protein [Clostridiales bacterium]
IKDPLIIEDRMRAAKLGFNDYIYVMVISADKSEQDNTVLQYLIKRIMEILKENKAVIYQNSIVMIITRNKGNPLQKDDLKGLIPYLRENRLYVGISSHFEHFSDLYKYYLQALKCLKIGLHLHKEKSIYSYEEYGIYQIMDICSAADNILNFCHQAMIDLSIYDRRNGTNLAYTLYTYLKNMQKQQETSDELSIYRSTLVRRINLIKKITNIHLNDENLSFHLRLTYKILEYIGYIKTKKRIL